ncbi:hypothetical protein Purlil1_14251 [Purpureocillium lilacinum]|uniref:Uncharacterized protein n=1 Tax=Purpureocillium lilacinum TaxID=33203 RepID=A0ABR0BBT4_PURLI|nr:hypothetical protein Purlil1_14251 [Purpureocillium lilacinum]
MSSKVLRSSAGSLLVSVLKKFVYLMNAASASIASADPLWRSNSVPLRSRRNRGWTSHASLEYDDQSPLYIVKVTAIARTSSGGRESIDLGIGRRSLPFHFVAFDVRIILPQMPDACANYGDLQPGVYGSHIMSTASGVFLGTVKVPLSLLYFIKATETWPCELQREEYAIPREAAGGSNAGQLPVDGYIDFSRASSVFSDLRLSPLELAQLNFQGTYPALRTQVIGLTQRPCQLEAAKKSHTSLSWTVNLFCMDLAGALLVEPTASASQGALGSGAGDSYIESSYPDGYIYAKLREYKDDDLTYARWQGELNAKKRRVIKLIYETPALEAAFDRLSAFPGLIESLQLTTYERLLSLHLEDEMVTGLCYIHRYWSKLLRFAMLSPPDKHTVTLLEGRAPAISERDRQTICRAFARGRVFSGTTDPVKRGLVEQGMIPGIESFQANLSLLAIAADIIWAHLLPADLRKVSGNERQSLKSILHGFWIRSQPATVFRIGL